MHNFLLRHADRLWAGLVFAAALIERLLFLFSSPEQAWPHSVLYEGDAPLWAEYAEALNRGQPFEFGLPIRTPGVAYLIHWLQPQGPPFDFVRLKVLWCVASAASCALAYLAFVQSFGRRVALIGAGLCAFSFGLDAIATSLNNETPYLLALSGIVLLTQRLHQRPSLAVAAALGALHGAATLLRAEHTLLLLLMLAASAWKLRRPGPPAALLAASVLVCLPWSVKAHRATIRFNETAERLPDYSSAWPPWTPGARAYLDSLPAFTRLESFRYFTHLCRKAGDLEVTAERVRGLYLETFGTEPEPLDAWHLVSSQGALSFALANHPQADGGFSKAGLDARWDPDPGIQPALPSHAALYNHGYRIGMEHITEDPARWLRLVGAKLANFGEGVTLGFTARNLPYGRGGVRRPVDLATPAPGQAWPARVLLFGALAAGAGLALRRRAGGVWLLIIVYKLIVTVAFYGYARQAVSILPAFYVFVALAAEAALGRLALRWRRLVAAGLVAGCIAVDVHGFVEREEHKLRVVGAVRPAPRWGPGAFESLRRLDLTPVEPSERKP
jgi:hypothetical protein